MLSSHFLHHLWMKIRSRDCAASCVDRVQRFGAEGKLQNNVTHEDVNNIWHSCASEYMHALVRVVIMQLIKIGVCHFVYCDYGY